jgi:hypothetical protein
VPENITTASTPRPRPDIGIDIDRVPILCPLTTHSNAIEGRAQVISFKSRWAIAA